VLTTSVLHNGRLRDASHERWFEPADGGFAYRLVVEYEPRGGIGGVLDRLLLPRGVSQAFRRTFTALERELGPASSTAG